MAGVGRRTARGSGPTATGRSRGRDVERFGLARHWSGGRPNYSHAAPCVASGPISATYVTGRRGEAARPSYPPTLKEFRLEFRASPDLLFV